MDDYSTGRAVYGDPEPDRIIHVQHPERKYTEEQMINFLEACTSTKHPYYTEYKNFVRHNPQASSQDKLNWFKNK